MKLIAVLLVIVSGLALGFHEDFEEILGDWFTGSATVKRGHPGWVETDNAPNYKIKIVNQGHYGLMVITQTNLGSMDSVISRFSVEYNRDHQGIVTLTAPAGDYDPNYYVIARLRINSNGTITGYIECEASENLMESHRNIEVSR